MSFESPSGAPAPQDAAPFTPPAPSAQPYQQPAPPYQGAPPFQGAPQYGAAPYPQNNAPYGAAGYPVGLVTGRPSSGFFISVMALAGVYVVLCLVEIFALNNRVSLANKLINDPTSVTVDQANSADSLVSDLSIAALVVFLVIIVLLAVWQRTLRSALAPTGLYQQVMKEARYQLFRVVWLVSILLAVVLRGSGTLDTPQDVVSHDHEYMAYYGVRAGLGVLLIFLGLQLKHASDRAFTQALSQAGYGAGAPVYPGR